jgi:hypothetical protein
MAPRRIPPVEPEGQGSEWVATPDAESDLERLEKGLDAALAANRSEALARFRSSRRVVSAPDDDSPFVYTCDAEREAAEKAMARRPPRSISLRVSLRRQRGLRPRRPVCIGREHQQRGEPCRRRGPPAGEDPEEPEPPRGPVGGEETPTRARHRAAAPSWFTQRCSRLSPSEELRAWCGLEGHDAKASADHIQKHAYAEPGRIEAISSRAGMRGDER